MENFDNILNSLNNLNKVVDIFVPSLNKTAKFTGLTAKQQKEALQCVMDKDFTGLTFSILCSEILLKNNTEKVPILAIEKNYLIVCLRALSLSNTYKTIADKIYDLNTIATTRIPLPVELKHATFSEGDLSVTVELPSIESELITSKESKKRLFSNNAEQTLTKEALGELYIDEIIKYFKSIKTPAAEVSQKELTFNQKYQIVENLPIAIIAKIVEYINKTKEFEKSLIDYKDEKQVISLDPSFFTV